MKSIIVALVLAFAITANCGLLKNVPSKAPVLSLMQIDQHPLGKSLLSLMALHMKAEGPLEDLPVLLQQIYDDVQTQIAENDLQHEEDEAYCADTENRLVSLISYHGAQFGIQGEIKEENEDALVRLNAHLEAAEIDLANNEQRTADGTAERQRQHDLYVGDLADNVDAIDATREAITLLNALRAGTSFVQLKGKMQKVQARLENTKTSKHTHIYTPLLKALAQITSKADKEVIARILDLLNNLAAQLEQARATIEETEATQAALWDQELADLTEEHARLVQDIEDTEADIANREEIVADATEAQQFHLENTRTNTENLILTKDECEVKRENYELTSEELARETDLVAALQDHFNSRFGGLSEYINSAPSA